ncbi:head-tail joining protein [Halomonas borealis]|uniref:head-tail joining protein n=1 Tax=Halomonas borealis TaxID=2508710 RepID=UPI0010A061DC|nr:hypothetical protein [Halomonas borealis]
MSFSDHADRLDEAVMGHLADTQSATYTPATGDPATIPVMVDRDVERTVPGMQGVVMERRTELAAYATDLAGAKRGEMVTVGDEAWRLVTKESDDGAFVTWIVKPDR